MERLSERSSCVERVLALCVTMGMTPNRDLHGVLGLLAAPMPIELRVYQSSHRAVMRFTLSRRGVLLVYC